MTANEIIDLADRLGLHCHHDDCPDPNDDETILIWHDDDFSVDAGIVVRFRDGQASVVNLKRWAAFTNDPAAHLGECAGACVSRCIQEYADRANKTPRTENAAAIAAASERSPAEDLELQPEAAAVVNGARDWRPRTQRKEGHFKAVDPLGRVYHLEIYAETTNTEATPAVRSRLVTAEGESVERIAKGQYRLLHANVELSSADPAAP